MGFSHHLSATGDRCSMLMRNDSADANKFSGTTRGLWGRVWQYLHEDVCISTSTRCIGLLLHVQFITYKCLQHNILQPKQEQRNPTRSRKALLMAHACSRKILAQNDGLSFKNDHVWLVWGYWTEWKYTTSRKLKEKRSLPSTSNVWLNFLCSLATFATMIYQLGAIPGACGVSAVWLPWSSMLGIAHEKLLALATTGLGEAKGVNPSEFITPLKRRHQLLGRRPILLQPFQAHGFSQRCAPRGPHQQQEDRTWRRGCHRVTHSLRALNSPRFSYELPWVND